MRGVAVVVVCTVVGMVAWCEGCRGGSGLLTGGEDAGRGDDVEVESGDVAWDGGPEVVDEAVPESSDGDGDADDVGWDDGGDTDEASETGVEELVVTVTEAPCGEWPGAAVTEPSTVPSDPRIPYEKWVYNPREDPVWTEWRIPGMLLAGQLAIDFEGSICLSGMGRWEMVGCLDREGGLAWTSGFVSSDVVVGSPVVAPDGSLFWMGAKGTLMKRESDGSVSPPIVLWTSMMSQLANHVIVGPVGTLAVLDDQFRTVVVSWIEGCLRRQVWVADGLPLAATSEGFWIQRAWRGSGGELRRGQRLWLVAPSGSILATVEPPVLPSHYFLQSAMVLTDGLVGVAYAPRYDPGATSVVVVSGLVSAPEWSLGPTRDDLYPLLRRDDGLVVDRDLDGRTRLVTPSGALHPIDLPSARGCSDPLLGDDGSVVFVCDTSTTVAPPGEDVLAGLVVAYDAEGVERYRLALEGIGPSADDGKVVLSRDGTLYYVGSTWVTVEETGRREVQGVLVAVQTDVPGLARDAWSREDRDARGGRSSVDLP